MKVTIYSETEFMVDGGQRAEALAEGCLMDSGGSFTKFKQMLREEGFEVDDKRPGQLDHKVIQQLAMDELKRDGEPTECPRCGAKPGDPGCGKIIHAIMDAYYERQEPKVDDGH